MMCNEQGKGNNVRRSLIRICCRQGNAVLKVQCAGRLAGNEGQKGMWRWWTGGATPSGGALVVVPHKEIGSPLPLFL